MNLYAIHSHPHRTMMSLASKWNFTWPFPSLLCLIVKLRGMPHDRQEARTGGSDWLKRPPNYHTTWSLRGGKMMWPGILVFWTTMVFTLEIHGTREKQDTRENRRMSTCNRLDLRTLGSQLIMPKNLLDHWSPLAGHHKQKSLRRCRLCGDSIHNSMPWLILPYCFS